MVEAAPEHSSAVIWRAPVKAGDDQWLEECKSAGKLGFCPPVTVDASGTLRMFEVKETRQTNWKQREKSWSQSRTRPILLRQREHTAPLVLCEYNRSFLSRVLSSRVKKLSLLVIFTPLMSRFLSSASSLVASDKWKTLLACGVAKQHVITNTTWLAIYSTKAQRAPSNYLFCVFLQWK